jgi:hypothetical protein
MNCRERGFKSYLEIILWARTWKALRLIITTMFGLGIKMTTQQANIFIHLSPLNLQQLQHQQMFLLLQELQQSILQQQHPLFPQSPTTSPTLIPTYSPKDVGLISDVPIAAVFVGAAGLFLRAINRKLKQ